MLGEFKAEFNCGKMSTVSARIQAEDVEGGEDWEALFGFCRTEVVPANPRA